MKTATRRRASRIAVAILLAPYIVFVYLLGAFLGFLVGMVWAVAPGRNGMESTALVQAVITNKLLPLWLVWEPMRIIDDDLNETQKTPRLTP